MLFNFSFTHLARLTKSRGFHLQEESAILLNYCDRRRDENLTHQAMFYDKTNRQVTDSISTPDSNICITKHYALSSNLAKRSHFINLLLYGVQGDLG